MYCCPSYWRLETGRGSSGVTFSASTTWKPATWHAAHTLPLVDTHVHTQRSPIHTVPGQTDATKHCHVKKKNQWLTLAKHNQNRATNNSSKKNKKKNKEKKCMKSDRLSLCSDLILEWSPACLYVGCMCEFFPAAEPKRCFFRAVCMFLHLRNGTQRQKIL